MVIPLYHCTSYFKKKPKASILAGNYICANIPPYGNPHPSNADIQLSRKLKQAGKLLDINLLDHLILMPGGYTSMADEGLI